MHPDQYKYLIGALLLYQLYTTILVGLTKAMDLDQKLRNIALIWALPLLGAIYARFAINNAEREAKQAGRSTGVQEAKAGKGQRSDAQK